MRRGERRTGQVREAIREELERDAREESREPEAQLDKPPVIEMQGVSLAFDRPILEDVSLVADEGETIVIVGESGKTEVVHDVVFHHLLSISPYTIQDTQWTSIGYVLFHPCGSQ